MAVIVKGDGIQALLAVLNTSRVGTMNDGCFGGEFEVSVISFMHADLDLNY